MSSTSKFRETEIGNFPEDWEILALSQLVFNITKGTTPTTLGGRFTDKGINFVKVESLNDDGVINTRKLAHIDEETNELLCRSKIKENDILFSIAGTIGRVAIATKDILPANTNQAVAIIRSDPAKIDLHYLRYALINPNLQKYLFSKVVHAVQPNLSLTEIRNCLIPTPKPKEQKAIAKILLDLDAKIQLNRHISKTFEAMGQTIFKHWFVDYEFPNEHGKPYKSSGGEMIESELGEIPKGWSVEKLEMHVDCVKGVSYKSEDLTESQNALVTLKCIERGGGFKVDGLKEYVGKYKEEQLLKASDIVVAFTDLTQKGEVLGKPALIRNVQKYHNLIASLDLMIVRPKNGLNMPFLWYLLKSEAFQNHAKGYANGTTVLHLSSKAIPEFCFTLPSCKIVDDFGIQVNAFLEKINQNELESEIFAQIRDILLPRLMTGKIRVPISDNES